MFPEPTELLLIGCLIDSIWTPRLNQIQWHQKPTRTHIDQGKFHTWWMESSFVFVQHQSFQFHQLSWSDVEKNARRCRWRKSHTAKSKPMMNLVSRCSERTRAVLSSTASESPGKTRQGTQTPLSPHTDKYDRTGRPVVCAHSSSYSEWNIDKTWSSQEWKSDELMDDDIKLAGKKQNINPMWKVLNKEVDLGEPTSFLDHVYLGCTQRQCEISNDIVYNYKTVFESRISAGRTENYHTRKIFVFLRGHMTWKVMPRNVWNDIVNWQARRLNNSTKYLLHASMTITSKKNWNPWENCQKYALKLFWNACTWHVLENLIFSGQWINLHDRSRNGPKPIESFQILHPSLLWIQTVFYAGNTAKQCRLGRFQDSDFAWDLEDSKSTSGGTLCVFGSLTFVPISWMCKKQTSVSHSSTESEIISLDAGLRLDGIPALDLWDLIVAVLGNTNQNRTEQGDLLKNRREVCSPRHTSHKRKQSQRVINDLDTVHFFPQTSNLLIR